METVVLGLGSNRGNSKEILLRAKEALSGILSDMRGASLYKTAPMHIKDQPDFYNTAVSGAFGGSPASLLEEIHKIEARSGRERRRERRWGERTLDIDILLFGSQIISFQSENALESLEIPHPRLKERRFALEPLLELLPLAKDPVTGENYGDICAALAEQGVQRLNAEPARLTAARA